MNVFIKNLDIRCKWVINLPTLLCGDEIGSVVMVFTEEEICKIIKQELEKYGIIRPKIDNFDYLHKVK